MYLLYSRPINTIVIPKLNNVIAELFTPIYHEHKRSAPTPSNQYKRETILAIQSKISSQLTPIFSSTLLLSA